MKRRSFIKSIASILGLTISAAAIAKTGDVILTKAVRVKPSKQEDGIRQSLPINPPLSMNGHSHPVQTHHVDRNHSHTINTSGDGHNYSAESILVYESYSPPKYLGLGVWSDDIS